jgi:hypothetical protein
MSFCFWKTVGWTLGLALGGSLSVHAQSSAAQRSQPIEFSEVKSSSASSNRSLITPSPVTPRNLEDDLKKPYELFGAGNSLSGAPAPFQRPPPPPPTLNNRRIRELMEKRDDWLFESPQDRDKASGLEALFQNLDGDLTGENSRRKNSLERIYERLDQTRAGSTNQNRNSDPFNLEKERQLGEALGFQGLGNSFGGENPVLNQLLQQAAKSGKQNQYPFNAEAEDPGLTRPFGLGKVEATPTTQFLQAQEARRETFRAILEPRSPTSASGISAAMKPFGDTTAPVLATTSPFATPATTSPANANANAMLGLVGKPGGPAELPRSSPELPSLTPTPPTDQPLKTEKPRPVSTFNLPRRTY